MSFVIPQKFVYTYQDLEKDEEEGQKVESVRFIKENSQFELMLDDKLRMIFDFRTVPWKHNAVWIVLVTEDIKSSIDDVVKKASPKNIGYMMGHGLETMNSFTLTHHQNKGLKMIMNKFMLTIMNVKCRYT
jgi:hypothetical protein